MPRTAFTARTESYIYYDNTGNSRPLAAYSPLVLATSTEVSTANTAGVRGGSGDIVTLPAYSTFPTARCVGVALNSCKNGQEVTVVVAGVAMVMANAAMTFAPSTLVFAAANGSRTNLQTPFTNNPEMLIPGDPELTSTYNIVLCDDLAITPADTGANARYFPVGYILDAATAQYDIVAVELCLTPFYG